MYYILNANGDICGESLDLFTPAEGLRLIAKDDYHPDPQAALAAAKTAKLHAAASAAQAFIETVAGLDGVPQFERDSWAAQALEAQAWAAPRHSPKATPTPRSPRPSPDSGRHWKTKSAPPTPPPRSMPSPLPTTRR